MPLDGEVSIAERRASWRALRRAGVNGTETGAAYRARVRSLPSRQQVLPRRPASVAGAWTAPAAAGEADGRGASPLLAVRLLGPLTAAIDGALAEEWPSARQRSLFGYLLTHRRPWPDRDVLMDVFWPRSSPVAARNNLNVTIHGLRKTLEAITRAPELT